jgi:hypothetical protein
LDSVDWLKGKSTGNIRKPMGFSVSPSNIRGFRFQFSLKPIQWLESEALSKCTLGFRRLELQATHNLVKDAQFDVILEKMMTLLEAPFVAPRVHRWCLWYCTCLLFCLFFLNPKMLYFQDKLLLLGILTESSPIVPVTYSKTEGLQSYLSRMGLGSHMLLLMGYHPQKIDTDPAMTWGSEG